MRVLLLGDSHLALLGGHRVARLERDLGAELDNAAFGGAWSGDLRRQVGDRDPKVFDVVLASIGTNDTHPAYHSSPDVLRRNVSEVLGGFRRTVLLLSPGVGQAPIPYDTANLNAKIQAYSDVAAHTVAARGGVLVATSWVVNELVRRAWASDGLHLSDESYDALLPSLARALSAAVSRR